jgi:hypothetical protein
LVWLHSLANLSMKTVQYSTSLATGREDVDFRNDAHPPILGPVPLTFDGCTTHFEEMTPNSDRDHKTWKPFEHYVAHLDLPGSANVYSYVSGSFYPDDGTYYSARISDPRVGYYGAFHGNGAAADGPFGDLGKPFVGLAQLYVKRADDNGFVPVPPTLGVLEARALRSMLPNIKSELSSLNSLYELKDLPSLPRTLRGLSRFAFSRGSRKTLRGLLRAGSDAYLQAQFNVLPLLSDIASVFRAVSSYERRLNDLLRRAGKRQSRHFAYSFEEYDGVADSTGFRYLTPINSIGPETGNAVSIVRNAGATRSQFHAQIEYNFNYTQYQVEHARLLGALDSLGVNLNPAIIWNAIPWSFVVDWVFGISRWLSSYKLENMEPQINILRYLWSIRRERTTILTRAHARVGTWPCPLQNTGHVGVVQEVAYRRQPGLPTTSSIESSGLNPKEFSFSAALVLSRSRRRTKVRR